MNNWMDKIWLWNGWLVIKWPFGALILWFVLLQIYNLETIPDYDKKVTESFKKDTQSSVDSIKNIYLCEFCGGYHLGHSVKLFT